jgi:hypothetical protein
MKLVGYIGMGLAVTLVSASALAFQEQGGAPVAPAPTEAQPAAPAGPAGQDLNFSTPKPADANSGTEVRIPGLGKLGVLPKMDFGLELLYGANEAKQQPEAQQPTEDLTIRGSLKHNF